MKELRLYFVQHGDDDEFATFMAEDASHAVEQAIDLDCDFIQGVFLAQRDDSWMSGVVEAQDEDGQAALENTHGGRLWLE